MNRMSFRLLLTILFILPLSQIVKANVVINEIMYDPSTTQCIGDRCEWIELFNLNESSVDVSGWKIIDSPGGTIHINSIPNRTMIEGNGYLIITKNITAFLEFYNSSGDVNYNIVSATSMSLDNTGDTLALNDTNNVTIDSLTYDDTVAWGGTGNCAKGSGCSLERIDPFGLANSSTNWNSSKVINGTPGRVNSMTPSLHDLAILPENTTFNPATPTPRSGVNITVTIQNLGLSNETNVNVSFYNISDFSYTLMGSRSLNISKLSSENLTIAWNNVGMGNHTILISIANVSGETNLTNNNATKNITVRFYLVINEIMYNPPEEIGSDVDFEWIEIYNNASYNENLTGWTLKCDSKTKALSGTLNSNDYLVFAKDVTEFYNYYSPSISAESETCSLNNDGDTITLVFNDSGIYYEESVTYSNSWGADGTGYSLEKVNPTNDNSQNNWNESKAYGGTPGSKNNPDDEIKSSLKRTEIIYRTSTSTSSSVSLPIPKEENYKILSYPNSVYIGEEFSISVSLKSDIVKTVTVYSYVFDGKKLLSEGFDGTKWKKTWDANKQEITIDPKSPTKITLKNRIKEDATSGDYKLRVRIKDEKDLTEDISILPKIIEGEVPVLPIATMICKLENNTISIYIRSNHVNGSLYVFDKSGLEIRNLTIKNETNERIAVKEGNNYIFLVQDNKILDRCYFDVRKPLAISGRAAQTRNILEGFLLWIKSILRF